MPLKGSVFLVAKSNCSSSCKTKDHETWGECVKAKSLRLSPHVNDAYSKGQKALDADLSAYRSARAQGIQPAGTSRQKVREAVEISERTGTAYRAA